MKTVVYKKVHLDQSGCKADRENYFRFVLWQPSLRSFILKGKSKKYFVYWLFHFLHIFKNRDYSAILVYENNSLISSLLMVPTYYKWPFMNKNDLQFTYVLTHSAYRGKGIAEKAIRYGISKMNKPGRCFWYVTTTDNVASKKLCTKSGFEFYSFAERAYPWKILKTYQK